MRCPICRTPVPDDAPEFPFCSRRCRTRDLANWSTGAYRIPVQPENEEGDQSATTPGDSQDA